MMVVSDIGRPTTIPQAVCIQHSTLFFYCCLVDPWSASFLVSEILQRDLEWCLNRLYSQVASHCRLLDFLHQCFEKNSSADIQVWKITTVPNGLRRSAISCAISCWMWVLYNRPQAVRATPPVTLQIITCRLRGAIGLQRNPATKPQLRRT